jgi:hypothetical protein
MASTSGCPTSPVHFVAPHGDDSLDAVDVDPGANDAEAGDVGDDDSGDAEEGPLGAVTVGGLLHEMIADAMTKTLSACMRPG